MFPQDFWLVSTVLLVGMTIVEVLALLALSWSYLQRRARRDAASAVPAKAPPIRGRA